MPPASAPRRFEPIASPANPDAANRLMKTMPAKKTGEQRNSVPAVARSANDRKKIASSGSIQQMAMVIRMPQIQTHIGRTLSPEAR